MTDQTIRRFVLTGAKKMQMDTVSRPELAPDEVMLQIERVGICGSDMEYFRHFACGAFVPREPLVLGHEFVGVVVEHGSDVGEPPLGTRVAVEPSIPCFHCDYCREGRYNLCRNMRFFGSASVYPHMDGGFRDLVQAPASSLIVLPDTLSTRQGALLEPLAVAVHAVRRAAPIDGREILVTGGGSIGQLVAMVLQAFGAAKIVVSDPMVERRELALSLAADNVLNPLTDDFNAYAASLRRGGFDTVFEASGQPAAIRQGLETIRKGGTFCQLGTVDGTPHIPFNLIMTKELNVIGSFRYAHDFQTALDLITRDAVNAEAIVTGEYPFTATPEAFAASLEPKHLKVHVKLTKSD
jgi:L-idonate 5-dehydrogenase